MKSHVTLLLAAALCVTSPGRVAADEEPAQAAAVPAKVAGTQDALRDLWIGHIFWVRNVVVARLADDDEQAQAAEQQVVANAQAIAGAIEPFYGAAASDRLFELLAGHWGAISDYLDATIAGRNGKQDDAADRLSANARDIAAFLSGANPNWPEETLIALLTTHGAHHVQQIEQLHAGQHEEEAATWAAMKDHMYVIADALTAGLAKQFPEKFE
ncbi:MAG TPA: hypothetical protein VF322_15620 [Gammaproteobacteria bacterium]